MTNEEIIKVAHIVAEYLDDRRFFGVTTTKLYPEDEACILNRYFDKYGAKQDD